MSEVINHLTVGSRVVIKHACAADKHGTTQGAVFGKITGTGVAAVGPEGKPTEGFLVAREDGQIGVGPGGEWFCAPEDLEPEILPMFAHVVLSPAEEGAMRGRVVGTYYDQPAAAVTYRVCYDDGKFGYYVPRLDLELVVAASAERPVAPVAEVTAPAAAAVAPAAAAAPAVAAVPEPVLPPAPRLVAEMADWNHDMSVPLNHGARFPTILPNDSAERKEYPLGSVWFGQFPSAMVALARHSWEGNNKHNPGMSLRDDRTKSNDDLECALRHLLEGDYRGAHWRVARLHQKQLEAEGAPVAPLAYFGESK
jgi:hypothetical protein